MAQVIRVLESFIHDLEEGETEMSEFGNVFGSNELKELLKLAKRGDPPQQPDIQPGDRVNYIGTQFPFLKNVKVDHIEIHRVGRVAALAYDDDIYKVHVDRVQKVDTP